MMHERWNQQTMRKQLCTLNYGPSSIIIAPIYWQFDILGPSIDAMHTKTHTQRARRLKNRERDRQIARISLPLHPHDVLEPTNDDKQMSRNLRICNRKRQTNISLRRCRCSDSFLRQYKIDYLYIIAVL